MLNNQPAFVEKQRTLCGQERDHFYQQAHHRHLKPDGGDALLGSDSEIDPEIHDFIERWLLH